MPRFEPIAIVGRACVLPGALTPAQLWDNVVHGRNLIGPVPEGRWRLDPARVRGTGPDRTWTDVGGYVRGFENVFDPSGFRLPASEVTGLDRSVQWALHCAREALRTEPAEGAGRTGIILGNLSFPTASMSAFAERIWLESQSNELAARARLPPTDARNRFMSGLPPRLVAQALGLGGPAFALDAACASSLYALKLACDALHDGTADTMLAGGVSGADDLFLHLGFCALQAMSRTGRSRPFHREADGLVPAEGAALVTLRRLSDAVTAKQPILGVIRGIGLSNDGRGRGFLAPFEEGQTRAMRQAWELAGCAPEAGLVECHATGTAVGDAAELRSLQQVFAPQGDLPIGSLKGNLGHLMTAAGAAGLLKVLGALEHETLPPTVGADEPLAELENARFRPIRAAEPWKGPRRAALSAFGFGGNNAHVVIEAYDGAVPAPVAKTPARPAIAIVAIGARVGDGDSAHDFVRSLASGTANSGPRQEIAVVAEGLRFPPRDLERTLPQQLLVLEAAREAAGSLKLPRERTSVLVGMGCDPEIARYGARWRSAAWAESSQLGAVQDAFERPLEAAGVIGTMPNVVANRINGQLDLGGPSFSVSAEEQSGTVALQLAARALREGEIDAALVGAVDLSHEPVHQAALAALGLSRPPGDAAVVLALKRLDKVAREHVICVLDEVPEDELEKDTVRYLAKCSRIPATSRSCADACSLERIDEQDAFDATRLFGHPHAATGLLQVASAAVSLAHGLRPQAGAPAMPRIAHAHAEIRVEGLDSETTRLGLRAGPTRPFHAGEAPALHVYSGADRAEVLARVAENRESSAGPARLAIVCGPSELDAKRELARKWLSEGGRAPEGLAFASQPIHGEIATVFTGAAAGYRGMGRELVFAFPDLVDRLATRSTELAAATAWAYGDAPRSALGQLWGTSFLCQLHALVSRDLLGIRAAATIGYSSGESNALLASGAWDDLDGMIRESRESGIFTRELGGAFAALKRVWSRFGVKDGTWSAFAIAAPVSFVRLALRDEPLAHLTIVNTADECVIGGESGAVSRVLDRIGRERAFPLEYALAAHCPEVEEIAPAWRALHRRPTRDPGVRIYTNASGRSFVPTADGAADAITEQAIHTLDFPRTIEQAWNDGVRIFLEHGPRAACSGWIRRTLGDREHLAISLDAPGRSAVKQTCHAIATLAAAGVAMDPAPFFAGLARASQQPPKDRRMLHFPAHPAPVRLPAREPVGETMPPAPPLPSFLADLLDRPPRALVEPELPVKTRGPVEELVAGVVAFQAELAEKHRAFLGTQAALHEQFLALQQRQLAAFAARAGKPLIPAVSAPTPAPRTAALPGPKWNRAELEQLASSEISKLFGPTFAVQDAYPRQVRMPQPPLLLADRVTGIDAEPASMRTGTIWTETDVREDSWYLGPDGRMPAGLMIEAGQADLLLISWLGADLLNRGERVYRLLGCELSYHGALPRPGETLVFDIHVDGHASQGDTRLFFFHYDCRVNGELRLSVRHGQAGFFTDRELAESGGVLWSASDEALSPDLRLAPGPRLTERRSLSREDLVAFSEGRPADCFGRGFEPTRAHVRSPRIAGDQLLLPHRVVALEPEGGPWKRGYLRAEQEISADDWFFQGHFKGDPCMPGTLMFDGCLQAMSVYFAALGFTIARDGWRFEPVTDSKYLMRCRGQVTPSSRLLAYEVFVREVHDGPEPTLYADVLCTVDGLKAFHARRVGLRLVPDWPLEEWVRGGPHVEQETGAALPLRTLGGLVGYREPKPVAKHREFAFDYASLLACAWGRPSSAFGPEYARFDSPRRVARLPGPPYHFMSRVLRVDVPMGSMRPGGELVVEYDVPERSWYFAENGHPTMPLCVLMEAALQPCGWFASYIGCTLESDTDLLFRNLDGTGTLRGEVRPGAGPLQTRVRFENISKTAGMTIVAFAVECSLGGTLVYEMKTVFGFFPQEAFENQVGLPATDEERARLASASTFGVDLTQRPERYCGGQLRLAGPMLLMLDRVTAFDPAGGRAGLGWVRGEKDVNPDEWFFKAHFFQDPVQPGSLGLEALGQLLQFFMLERGLDRGLARPRFEPLMLDAPLTWKYRGQVVPTNARITTELEVLEIGEDARGRFAVADASLWVDGRRIYQAKRLGMRITG